MKLLKQNVLKIDNTFSVNVNNFLQPLLQTQSINSQHRKLHSLYISNFDLTNSNLSAILSQFELSSKNSEITPQCQLEEDLQIIHNTYKSFNKPNSMDLVKYDLNVVSKIRESFKPGSIYKGESDGSAIQGYNCIVVDQIRVSGANNYALLGNQSLFMQLNYSTFKFLSTFSYFSWSKLSIIQFQKDEQNCLIIKFDFVNMVKALFCSALGSFSKKRPKNCASILVDLILSCLDAPSDVNLDELFELCSASCPSSTCVKLSLAQQVISDEIYMICESLAYREMERQLTCTDSYGENFISTSALLRYSDYISSDDHVIAIFVHMTESVTDYIVYIFPQDKLASIERYNNGNTLVLDNEFSHKVLTFLENLYQGPNIPGKKQLHSLYLSNSSNNPYPISTIITQFQHSLKYLKIDAKCIYGEDLNPLCQILASSKTLISFSFIGNCTSLFLPDLLASLTTSETICEISFKGCDLPSEAFSKSSANLCRIDPDHYSMSYNEMEVSLVSSLSNHFQNWKLLQSLSLSHCNITSEILTYLLEGMKECKNLYALNLSNNKIGDEGCTNLARAFLHQSKPGCTYLCELNLSHCDIGDNGILTLADLIKEISANLFSFDIGGNRLSIVGAYEISRALQACENLVELCLELPELQNVDKLNMAYHKSFIKCIMNVLQTTFKLRKLLLSNLQMDNAQAQYIAEIIRRNKYLKNFKLSNCCNKESQLEPLFMRQGLFHTLDLSHNTFSSNDFDFLCQSLKSCKFLSYVNLRGISIFKSDEALQLQNLDISWTVQEIYLDNINLLAGIYRVAEIIVKCEKLRVLSISDCNIGDIGAIEIANGVKHCVSLQILDLRYNNIVSDTISSISAILCECCNLQILA